MTALFILSRTRTIHTAGKARTTASLTHRTTLGSGLVRTGTNTGTPREPSEKNFKTKKIRVLDVASYYALLNGVLEHDSFPAEPFR